MDGSSHTIIINRSYYIKDFWRSVVKGQFVGLGPRCPIKEISKLSAKYESVRMIYSFVIGCYFNYHNTVIMSGGRTERKYVCLCAYGVDIMAVTLLSEVFFQISFSGCEKLQYPPSLLVYYYFFHMVAKRIKWYFLVTIFI